MNLVVTGHVDHGKSTGLGHLLFQLGQIHDPKKKRPPWRIAQQYFVDSKKQGMGSWSYAWILDPLVDERARGLTINISFQEFSFGKYTFNLIDAPGHQDFVKNMITGASQADAAILVFSAKTSEFGAAIADNGQGREHAFLAKTLGVKKIILAVNKMDDASVDYSESRFNEVKDEVTQLLKIVGYNTEKDVSFVPVSAFVGDNLNVKSDNM